VTVRAKISYFGFNVPTENVDSASILGKVSLSSDGRLTIRARQTSAQITVEVQPDRQAEDDESFIVQLSTPIGVTLLNDKERGRIHDNDSSWLSTTTFPGRSENRDIPTGRCRPLNRELAPFHLLPPQRSLFEACTANNCHRAAKSLGLGRIASLVQCQPEVEARSWTSSQGQTWKLGSRSVLFFINPSKKFSFWEFETDRRDENEMYCHAKSLTGDFHWVG
jgi:hypothetical protein